MVFGIRRWSAADAEWYIAARDETILRWTTEPRELTVSEFVETLDSLDGVDKAGFALTSGGSSLVGNLAAVRRGDVAELSYWVAAAARGKGAATAGLHALTAWVEANWDVATLELLIHPDNLASIGVAERCGYTLGETREVTLDCAGPEGVVVIYSRHPRSA